MTMNADLSGEDMHSLVRRLFVGREIDALGEIANRYYPKFRALARRLLRREPMVQQVYDADEAVDSGLGAIVYLVVRGKVGRIEGVDGFWRLFRRILARKILAVRDREAALKRDGKGIPGHGPDENQARGPLDGARTAKSHAHVPDDFNLFESGLPSAEVVVAADEMTGRLLAMLSEDLEIVVRMRFERRTIRYIAEKLGISTRTVDRRLEQIRAIWIISGLLEGAEED
jgi:DNA-directed RNA polymerase specialized sigma24 family protein